MKKLILLSVVFAIAAPALAAKVDLVKGENKVDVKINGKLFTTYKWGDDWTKPFLEPITTPSGIQVSRRHPLTEL